jgi:hypothetical protein
MEVSGQLGARAALTPRENCPVPIRYEAGEGGVYLRRKEKYQSLYGGSEAGISSPILTSPVSAGTKSSNRPSLPSELSGVFSDWLCQTSVQNADCSLWRTPKKTGLCLKYEYLTLCKSHDSSVGIALGYGLDDRGSRIRFPAGAGKFSLHHYIQNGSRTYPASCPTGIRGSFPGGKAAGAWSWPLTSI